MPAASLGWRRSRARTPPRACGSRRRREEESDDGQSSRAPGSTTSTSTSATASSNGGRPKSAKAGATPVPVAAAGGDGAPRAEARRWRGGGRAPIDAADARGDATRRQPRQATRRTRLSARTHDANACAPGPAAVVGRLTRGGEDGCLIDVSGEEAPQKQMVVPLERLEVRPGTRPYCNSQEPLERVARIVRAGRENQAPRCPHDSHEARDEISPSSRKFSFVASASARGRHRRDVINFAIE